MIVAALLDAGADIEAIKAQLAGLKLPGFSLATERVNRAGLSGLRFCVQTDDTHHEHRNLAEILAMIDRANLPARAAQRARQIFQRLGEVEAKAHGVSIDMVHFHEVGAVDSIVDIVAACLAMEMLSVDRVFCSAIPTGSGTVKTAHGLFPVPAPATAALLVGAKTFDNSAPGEVTTPTGAAILTVLAESFGGPPEMEIAAVGYGAGTRNSPSLPNVLRVFIGKAAAEGAMDTVVELSANLDDCTGEVLGATIESLLAAGCLDAWAVPIYMKKSRPAWMLGAICRPADVEAIERLIFSQTTTFGVRRRTFQRSKLLRSHQTVQTHYGPIRIKVGTLGGQMVTASPEFSDCLQASQSHHVAVKEVLQAAQTAYRESKG